MFRLCAIYSYLSIYSFVEYRINSFFASCHSNIAMLAIHLSNVDKFAISVRLGIGGFSMGAAAALHSAACYTHGRFTNGIAYPITLSAVISLSGWLPCSRFELDLLV